MISAEYAYSSRQARDLLKKLDKDVHDGLAELGMQWVEHYRTVAQPEIFEAHERGARSGGGGRGHPGWLSLTEEYLASAVKRDSPHAEDIMQLTGALRGDLETGWGEGYTTSERYGDDVLIEIGSRREYGVWAGGGQGGPRQVMYLTADTVTAFEAITNSFISRLIVEARKAARASSTAEAAQLDRAFKRTVTGGGGKL